jgi:L-amino acid N-acyltransferase YncA
LLPLIAKHPTVYADERQINDLAPDDNDPVSERRIHIRDSCDDDVLVIASIYAHHVLHGTASFGTEAPSGEEMNLYRNESVRRDYPYIVAEDSSGVVGCAYAGPYRPRPAYRDTVENSIYLRHDTIGRGIGGLLLNALIEMCERRDYRQLIAVVGDSANTASVHLHERAGFRLVVPCARSGLSMDVGLIRCCFNDHSPHRTVFLRRRAMHGVLTYCCCR